MIRGISFQTPNGYFGVFADITKNIEINRKFWFILDDQIYHRFDGESFFESDKYNGDDFEKKISDRNYYVYFANIQAFPTEKDFVGINTYDDFHNSKCEIIILIIDSYFVDVYAKDENTIEKIKLNALESGFTKIDYITEQNDRNPELRAV